MSKWRETSLAIIRETANHSRRYYFKRFLAAYPNCHRIKLSLITPAAKNKELIDFMNTHLTDFVCDQSMRRWLIADDQEAILFKMTWK